MAAIARLLSRPLVALFTLLLCHTAFADPPGRVGRLADVQGQVWLYDAETAEWVAAVRNRPLTSGDRVSTDGNARAELRVGSTTLRLDAGTEVELLQLDDDIVRVQLHNGLLALRLRTHEAAREFELVTAEGRFKPDRAGRYRLDRIDATSSITVWSGQILFESPDNAVTVSAGQRADILNNGRTQYTLVQPQRDAFADEVAAAELADERSVSTRYVSPEMTGVEELDRHGRWENDADYGALWVPRAVVPGWAPYRYGHWAWVRPWGWTWVDDAAWGFAPFHYGRWVFLRNNWCWSPGRWVARPVYAPALVAWVGVPNVGVSIGIGPSVGWFPLGPREVFVPGYRSSPTYVRNVNVTQVTNITNVTHIINTPNTVVQQTNYINRGVPGAMTVVPASVVSGRQPVAPSRVQLTDPRPGAGAERNVTVAGLQTVTAAPQIAPPSPRAPRTQASGPAQPAAAVPAGNANPAGEKGAAPGPVAAMGIATPAVTGRGVVPAPPLTQPVVRAPRPTAEPDVTVPGAHTTPRPVAQPAPAAPQAAAPQVAATVRPAPNPLPRPNTAAGPKATPQAAVPQPHPAAAAPVAQPAPPAQPRSKPLPLPMPPQPVEAVRTAPPVPVAQPALPQTAAPAVPKPQPAPKPAANEAKDEPREKESPKGERR